MNEIKTPEIEEIKKPEPENYKEIKSDKVVDVETAKSFFDNLFNEMSEYYNSYADRLGYTPKIDSVLGSWEGERGESKFIPTNETESGRSALEKLAEKGLDGIEYKNAEPDFSKCAESTVKIDNMTENRYDYFDSNTGEFKRGNFTQADIACAQKWNDEAKFGRTDWDCRAISDWRHENRYSWHERCDTETMDLVPFDIHSQCTHLGGVSECKVRDSIDLGGEFDE